MRDDACAPQVMEHEPSEAPLFLYLAWTEVHDPYLVDDTGAVGHSTRRPTASRGLRRSGCAKGAMRAVQRSMLGCVDDATPNPTAALQVKGMWQNTLMLWSSDNGGVLVSQGNNSPLRGGATLFEGGMRAVRPPRPPHPHPLTRPHAHTRASRTLPAVTVLEYPPPPLRCLPPVPTFRVGAGWLPGGRRAALDGAQDVTSIVVSQTGTLS